MHFTRRAISPRASFVFDRHVGSINCSLSRRPRLSENIPEDQEITEEILTEIDMRPNYSNSNLIVENNSDESGEENDGQETMPKRALRPIYSHNGFAMRPVKVLSSGGELLHCVERKTTVQCGALGRRELDGTISLSKPHTGHMSDDGKVNAKIARVEIKEIAQTTELSPRDIIHETKMKYGVRPVIHAGSTDTLNRIINRQRDERCEDSEAVDSDNPIFQGKMTKDNDGEKFMIFDLVCPTSQARHVGFASTLDLEILRNSKVVLSDGTFDVARAPFKQIWCFHAQFGDAIVPVVHVLMSSRSTQDYEFVLENVKKEIPTWNPTDYMGDLEIGQSKAFTNMFPSIRVGFCFFHLIQAWYRKMKQLKLEDLVSYGGPMYEFWSLLKCLPFGDVSDVEHSFEDIWNLIPTPITMNMQKLKEYFIKFYVSDKPSLMFPPIKWNVVSRSIRDLPRTTNTVESSHRNLERCIQCTKGRSTPLLSELLRCLRQESSKRKFDKETIEIDPSYRISTKRKLKDELKDTRVLNALRNTQGLQGLDFFKAIRAARKYN